MSIELLRAIVMQAAWQYACAKVGWELDRAEFLRAVIDTGAELGLGRANK